MVFNSLEPLLELDAREFFAAVEGFFSDAPERGRGGEGLHARLVKCARPNLFQHAVILECDISQ